MADETNQPVAGAEPTPGASPATPETTPDAKVAVSTPPDWHKALESVPEEELVKHPRYADLLKRQGQAEANRILAKDRARIAQETQAQLQQEMANKRWEDKWQSMSRQERGEFLVRSQEMQEEFGKTIGQWWDDQSKGLKDAIPEFKDKPIEEWQALIQQYPASFKDLVAAAINEAVEARIGKELPKRVKEAAEASVKEQVQKTIASGKSPDMKTGVGSPNFAAMSPGELRDKIRSMTPAEYAEHEDEILASVPARRR